MKYYRNLYRLETKDYMMALELDNGTLVECLTEVDVNKCCTTSGNTTSITVNGSTFRKDTIKSVYFGNLWDLNNIPPNFCGYFSNLSYIDPLPTMITSIGSNTLVYCSSLNQPLTLPVSIMGISSAFMYSCYNFTGPLNILFTDPKVFSVTNTLATDNSKSLMYTVGITITGNMTGTQLRTRLPNKSTLPGLRKILD